MYRNKDGALYNLNYAQASSAAADPIEKKPLFHFFPDTSAFSLGSWGCNFHCQDCQNWEISCPEAGEPGRGSHQVKPETAIELATGYHCRGIAWTYNEPTIWFEYTLDSARLARERGLYTVYVTNGYITPEALDMLGPYLDAFRVDVKGFTDKLYRYLAKVTRWREVLEAAVRAKAKWGMHVEVVTNIIPTLNDDEAQLTALATWIRDSLGELTPWHITRFYPSHQLLHLPSTPIPTLERAYKIGKRVGLKFVYLGNVPGHPTESTTCYSCGKVLVERSGYQTRILGVTGSRCPHCGAEIYMRIKGGQTPATG
jgi:pyruvate formate lyase activating enzyme